ncbi:MAG TPA: Ig domain-containing protein [Candidatus Ornithomonoglobus merdipullorum]|uniref:Ig domain-containing protein n=1 Tax=Candidatus Ornithomonoglobus merdipullorum TaxID=2840895 RepID=A0A9D1MCK7_9FIRM|nr:Ig domain-containing protein [Candidatus Ornithomonoglobus merdipullorum]
MKWSESYSGWDFDSTWAIDDSINDGYPYLQNEKSIFVAVTGLSLDKTDVSLQTGSQLTLTPIFTPENASDRSVSWSTSSRYVATVTDGVVTAIAPGTAVITAATGDGAHSDSCTVTVYEPEPLDYSVNSVTVANGGSKLRAEVSVTKNSDTTDGVVIIWLYDSTGALSDYIFIDGDLDRDKTYTLGGTLPSEPGGTVKAFVWDSLDSMQPISNSAEQRL